MEFALKTRTQDALVEHKNCVDFFDTFLLLCDNCDANDVEFKGD
jgi:hypothetical protein